MGRKILRFYAETPAILRSAENQQRFRRWASWLMGVFSLGMLGCMIGAYRYEARFMREAVRVRAHVVKVEQDDKADHVTYEFVDAAGKNWRDSAMRRRGENPLGSSLEVLYVPGRPRPHVKVVGFVSEWALTVICGILAVPMGLSSAMWRLMWRRRQRLIDAFKADPDQKPPWMSSEESKEISDRGLPNAD